MNKLNKFLILLIAWIFCIFFFAYKVYFENEVKSKRYVNEILDLKVDSISINDYSYGITYDLYIDGKYLMKLDSTKYVPFKHVGKVDLIVKDVYSNYVIADFLTFDSDMKRMFKYATDNIKKLK